MAALATTSFVAAMTEAVFLVLVSSAVLSLANQSTAMTPLLGLHLTVDVALLVCGVGLALRLILMMLSVRVSSTLSTRVRSDQRRDLAGAYLRANWATQHDEAAGRLQELLTSFVSRVNSAVIALTTGITAVLSLAAFLLAGVGVNPFATLAVIVVLTLLGGVLFPVRRSIRRRSAASVVTDLEFSRGVAEVGSLGREIHVFGVRPAFEASLHRLISTTSANQQAVLFWQGALTPLYTTFAYAAVLIGLGVLRWVGLEDLSEVGAVTLLMLRSLSYGQQLLAVSGVLASSAPTLDKLNEALDTYARELAPRGTHIPRAATPLTLEDVSFAYMPGRSTLDNLSLTVRRGETLGVIGPSGAGKSTLIELLLGLREPTSGAVAVNGVDLVSVDRDWWSQRVAFVPQDALLFNGTVADNIRFMREQISDQEVLGAARNANILKEIHTFPDGFETNLGERGNRLSGGQRQRLSIARALAGEPELIVLDEPTSALDGESEKLVRQTMADLHGKATIIVVAHRMSTLDICDRIVVLESGRITAVGTPLELHGSSDFYRRALAVAGIS